MWNHNVLVAFALTLFAGLSTGIGGLITLLFRKTNKKFLSYSMGFSGGVMIYVSFVEIFSEASQDLTKCFGNVKGSWVTIAGFFGGMLLIALIDKLIPSYENPHETRLVEDMNQCQVDNKTDKLMRTGILVAIAITVHNFPEGLASFTSALKETRLGIAIAIAIAIHNIPEGISVSVPIFCATGSRKKAFWLSLLSGLAEPLGALIGYLILMPILNDVVFGIVFAGVAGIMVFISLDELLPSAREYGESHESMFGIIAGMMVMAVSLILFM